MGGQGGAWVGGTEARRAKGGGGQGGKEGGGRGEGGQGKREGGLQSRGPAGRDGPVNGSWVWWGPCEGPWGRSGGLQRPRQAVVC